MKCLVFTKKDNIDFYNSSQAYPFFKCRCKNCKEWKKIENKKWRINKPKSYNAKYRKKHYENNKNTILKNAKDNYQSNKDIVRQYQQQYFKTEEGKEAIRRGARKRRARKKNTPASPYTENQVLEIYGNTCHLCGTEIDLLAPRQTGKPGWQKGLHIEHVIGIAMGGEDTIHNVKPSHAICNLSKKRKESATIG